LIEKHKADFLPKER